MNESGRSSPSKAWIEFAPLNIPLERRLQTFAALHWSATFPVGIIGGILLFVFILLSRFYLIALFYLLWLCYDRNVCYQGGRGRAWFRKWSTWRHFRDYFPIRLIQTTPFDPNRNYMCGYHPHGILSAGAFCNFGTEATDFSNVFPGITPHLITLKANFFYPFLRDYIICTGASSPSKENFEYILKRRGKGNAIFLVVGGANESLDARPNQVVLTLKKRKGFIKIAIRCGADLVPVISFGENDIYDQAENPEGSLLRSIQTKLKDTLGFTIPLFYGRGIFQYTYGFLPYRRPIHTVVGKPIQVIQDENPSEDTINKYHAQYMENLQQLFDEYKVKLGDTYRNLVLKIH